MKLIKKTKHFSHYDEGIKGETLMVCENESDLDQFILFCVKSGVMIETEDKTKKQLNNESGDSK